MSLLYIIDACNVINHPRFIGIVPRRNKGQKLALLGLMRSRRLCGSPRNSAVVVFDGYPENSWQKHDKEPYEVVFSYDDTADEKIKKILQKGRDKQGMIVVSDDKEIRFFAKAHAVKSIAVEDFLPEHENERGKTNDDLSDDELGYSQKQEINRELKDLWLKQNSKFKA